MATGAIQLNSIPDLNDQIEFSICFWAKKFDSNDVIAFEAIQNITTNAINFEWTAPRMFFAVRNLVTENLSEEIFYVPTLNDEELVDWNHITLTFYSGEEGTDIIGGVLPATPGWLRLYVNANLVSETIIDSDLKSRGKPVASNVADNCQFEVVTNNKKGPKLSDIRIFNRSLVDAEIIDIYTYQQIRLGLIGWWGTDNPDLEDYSINNNSAQTFTQNPPYNWYRDIVDTPIPITDHEISANLRWHYPLNEPLNVNDVVPGSSDHGVLQPVGNGPTYDPNGPGSFISKDNVRFGNGSRYFNGSQYIEVCQRELSVSSTKDYVLPPHRTAANGANEFNAGGFSISVWVRSDRWGSGLSSGTEVWDTIFGTYVSNDYVSLLVSSQGRLRAVVQSSSTERRDVMTKTSIFPKESTDTGWQHIVWVATTAEFYLYVNGSLVVNIELYPGLTTWPTSKIWSANTVNSRFFLGAFSNSNTTLDPRHHWRGWISDFRVYDAPLTSRDVVHLTYPKIDKLSGAPIHWWDLTENSWLNSSSVLSPLARPPLFADGNVTVAATQGPNTQGAASFDGATTRLYTDFIDPIDPEGIFETEMSFSIWFRPDSLNYTRVCTWKDQDNRGFFEFNYDWDNGSIVHIRIHGDTSADDPANNNIDLTSVGGVNTGLWHHVAFVLDADDKWAKLYINNELVDEVTNPNFGLINTSISPRFALGARSWGTGILDPFDGFITQVGLWNRKLTDNDIHHLYNTGLGRLHFDLLIDPYPLYTFDYSSAGKASYIFNDSRSLVVHEPANENTYAFTDGVNDIPFTLSCWIKITSLNDGDNFIALSRAIPPGDTNASGTKDWEFGIINFNGTPMLGITFNAGLLGRFYRFPETTGTFGLADSHDEWIHILATYDGQGGVGNYLNDSDPYPTKGIKLWLNGARVDNATQPEPIKLGTGPHTYYTTMDLLSDASLFIGGLGNLSSPFANNTARGNIANVKIFNRELTDVEIQNLTDPNIHIDVGCIGWWLTDRFDSNTDNLIRNHARNGKRYDAAPWSASPFVGSFVEGPEFSSDGPRSTNTFGNHSLTFGLDTDEYPYAASTNTAPSSNIADWKSSYIRIKPDNDALLFTDRNGTNFPFTICGWFKIMDNKRGTNFELQSDLIGKVNSNNDPNREWYLKMANDQLQFWIWNDRNQYFVVTSSNENITARNRHGMEDHSWVHLAASYNGGITRDSIDIYINGKNVSDTRQGNVTTWTQPASIQNERNAYFYIGGFPNISNHLWGRACDIRVYDRLLNEGDLRNIIEFNPSTFGLVGHWITDVDDIRINKSIIDYSDNNSVPDSVTDSLYTYRNINWSTDGPKKLFGKTSGIGNNSISMNPYPSSTDPNQLSNITIPGTDFDFTNTSAFTISFWINVALSAEDQFIMGNRMNNPTSTHPDDTDYQYIGWEIWRQCLVPGAKTVDRLSIVFCGEPNGWGNAKGPGLREYYSNDIGNTIGVALDNNGWHHVCFTKSASGMLQNTHVKCYVDGQLINLSLYNRSITGGALENFDFRTSNAPSLGGPINGVANDFHIGLRNGDLIGGNQYYGNSDFLSDIRIYDVELDINTIQNLMTLDYIYPDPQLGWWVIGGPTGNDIRDWSGAGNHGVGKNINWTGYGPKNHKDTIYT